MLPATAVAPTSANTLPSQAMLYAIARATQHFPTPEAVAALRAARRVARHKAVPKQLDRYLKHIERALAERIEVAFRLPDLGFDKNGVLRTPVGEHTASITVPGPTAILVGGVELTWTGPDGKRRNGVPASVRRDHADRVAELRTLVKQVGNQLTTFGRALESGYSSEKTWPYLRWRAELATNPLARAVTERLIWEVEVEPGRWRAGMPPAAADVEGVAAGFEDVAGDRFAVPADGAAVRLWHPIRAGVDEIRSWRELLIQREIRQPFKQAFREIHLLTPAEVQTQRYSNRFAAHIVAYRRFFAMLRERGWGSTMLGGWDGGESSQGYGEFAGGQWRAGFRHEYVHPVGEVQYASTDQVRFERRRDGRWQPVDLADVPALVFSEAMRDIDLFVAVTSVAADADWADRGEHPYAEYRQTAGFGELTAIAEVRRDALQRIVPRLAIADRCHFEGRYLVVRGDLRTYKIHLGSANILMEPDGSYLCIVAARQKRRDRIFLPFEEDRLSVILSKALLLADDSRITDESILRQIKG